MGDFEAVNVNGQVTKNGGNVASYFLTPEGRMIHAVLGPAKADVLQREAQWAVETYRAAQDQSATSRRLAQLVSQAHAQRSGGGWDGRTERVHRLLAEYPLPPLVAVYEHMFEDILRQKVSKAGPTIARVEQRLETARQRGKPVLFVFYKRDRDLAGLPWTVNRYRRVQSTPALAAILPHWVVVPARLKEMAALSSALDLPQYEFPSRDRLTFVLAHNDGRQIVSLPARLSADQLALALAERAPEAYSGGLSEFRARAIRRTLDLLEKHHREAAVRTRIERARRDLVLAARSEA